MPLELLNEPGREDGRNPVRGSTYSDDLPAELIGLGSMWQGVTVELAPMTRRTYGWRCVMDLANRAAWQDWIEARGHNRDPFLVYDPWDNAPRELTLEPAVGDGVRTVFSLPTSETDAAYRYYPYASSVVGKVAGAPVAVTTTDVDARTIQFTVPPGAGLAVTAVMVPLRLVRLDEPAEHDSSDDEGMVRVSMKLVEVLRPSTGAGVAYFGDLKLWRELVEVPQEVPTRGTFQKFQGVARKHQLVSARSPGHGLQLELKALGMPNIGSRTSRGWLALSRAMRRALWDRSAETYPLVWVDEPTKDSVISAAVVGTFTTSSAHAYAVNDVLLVRRAGVGNWVLVTVTAVAPTTVTYATTAGEYTPAINDEVHLVEAYWRGMVHTQLAPMRPDRKAGGWFAREVSYTFEGSGRLDYARTDASFIGS